MFGKKKAPQPQPKSKKAKTITTPDGKTFPSLAGKAIVRTGPCKECGGRGTRHSSNCYTWHGNRPR
jgi:hypothetical protein